MLRWGIITPFERPVVPPVWASQQILIRLSCVDKRFGLDLRQSGQQVAGALHGSERQQMLQAGGAGGDRATAFGKFARFDDQRVDLGVLGDEDLIVFRRERM